MGRAGFDLLKSFDIYFIRFHLKWVRTSIARISNLLLGCKYILNFKTLLFIIRWESFIAQYTSS